VKLGTLLKDSQTGNIGVVIENNDTKMTIYWSESDTRERFFIENFNKWILAGIIKPIEIKRRSYEQSSSR
jgi:hypothetical protein